MLIRSRRLPPAAAAGSGLALTEADAENDWT